MYDRTAIASTIATHRFIAHKWFEPHRICIVIRFATEKPITLLTAGSKVCVSVLWSCGACAMSQYTTSLSTQSVRLNDAYDENVNTRNRSKCARSCDSDTFVPLRVCMCHTVRRRMCMQTQANVSVSAIIHGRRCSRIVSHTMPPAAASMLRFIIIIHIRYEYACTAFA